MSDFTGYVDSAIFVLLFIWFLMDRCNVYFIVWDE